MNLLGKTLVFFLLVLSMAFGTFSWLIFSNRIDWGRKDPRLEYGFRVPSEFDKRAVAVTEAAGAKLIADGKLEAAQIKLAQVVNIWPNNHLFYNEELAKLRSAAGVISVNRIAIENGQVKIDSKTLLPILDPAEVMYTNAQGQSIKVDRSLSSYRQGLEKVIGDLTSVRESMIKMVEDFNKMTALINGEFDDQKRKVRPGLYDLLEKEVAMKKKVKEEIGQIEPVRIRELVNRSIMLERQNRLQYRLQELKNMASAPKN